MAENIDEDLSKWTVDRVCKWLEEVVIVPQSVISCFRDEEIDGYNLSIIKENDMDKICPNIKFGVKNRIIGKRNELLCEINNLWESSLPPIEYDVRTSSSSVAQENSFSQSDETEIKVLELFNLSSLTVSAENNNVFIYLPSNDERINVAKFSKCDTETIVAKLRKIDETADEVNDYLENAIVYNLNEHVNVNNPLDAVHKYSEYNLSIFDIEVMRQLCTELVRFAGACLQSGTNGTIHIGITIKTSDGRRYGQIIGTNLACDKLIYESMISDLIKQCFKGNEQFTVFSNSIRKLQFIKVNGSRLNPLQKKYVLEMDIVPCENLEEAKTIFVSSPIARDGYLTADNKENVYYYEDNTILKASYKQMLTMPDLLRQRMSVRRNAAASSLTKGSHVLEIDLKEQLVPLICLGDERLKGDIYPVLVINKPTTYMNEAFIKENFQFIRNIKWKAIFDFDDESLICNCFEKECLNMRVIASCNEFEPKYLLQDKGHVENIQKAIQSSEHIPWIFVNGLRRAEKERLLLSDWKRYNREGFREASRFFFKEMIIKDREIIIYIVLSNDVDVLLECFDIISNNQWVFIGEDNDTMTYILNEMLQRKVLVNPITDKNRFISGLPWSHLQSIMFEISTISPVYEKLISCSTGAFITLQENFTNTLTDLEIVASNECESLQKDIAKEELIDKELTFYKGAEVSWWNFWCKSHVIERDIIHKIKQQIILAVQNGSDGEDFISKIFLYHQPGSGATTIAKQILWDFRKDYRCAVVRTINHTEHTVKQIMRFRSYEETTNSKCVLLLFDNNLEEELVSNLLKELNEQAKRRARDVEKTTSILCVCLICIRRTTLPTDTEIVKRNILLKQALSDSELRAFTDKLESLENNGTLKYDPKLLISLNIMKEGFSTKATKKFVEENVAGMSSSAEKNLLKFIALINTFDIDFTYLPTAAFNAIMNSWFNEYKEKSFVQSNGQKYIRRWETSMSSEFCNLTNQTRTVSLGEIQSIRMAHPLLSRLVLDVFMEKDNTSLGQLARELLFVDIPYIYAAEKQLLQVIIKLLIVRQVDGKGRKHAFSPLIEELLKEGRDLAAEILRLGFERTTDSRVAQHLARFYSQAEDWKSAIRYSEEAATIDPQNSFVTDTCGRVLLNCLQKKYEVFTDHLFKDESQSYLSSSNFITLIELADKALHWFQETQKLACNSYLHNEAGYFGEVQTIILLLDCLSCTLFTDNKTSLKQFLADESFYPPNVAEWTNQNGENIALNIKNWVRNASKTLTQIEDKLTQLVDDTPVEFKTKIALSYICKLRTNMVSYCGEDTDEIPEHYNEQMKCAYRRRRMYSLESASFSWTLENASEENCSNFERIISLAIENIQSRFSTGEDFRSLIASSLILYQLTRKIYIPYDQCSELSITLFNSRKSLTGHLEPYLFFCMLRWPRLNVSVNNFATLQELKDAVKAWKEDYDIKNPRQKKEANSQRDRDKSVFYFAKGKDYDSVISAKLLTQRMQTFKASNDNGNKGHDFWHHPLLQETLQRFEGILCQDGKEVRVLLNYPTGARIAMLIPSSYPHNDTYMWNKTVYFIIGFSWLGPKAYDVKLDKPPDWDKEKLNYSKAFFTPSAETKPFSELSSDKSNITLLQSIQSTLVYNRKKPQISTVTHDDFSRELKRLREKLKDIDQELSAMKGNSRKGKNKVEVSNKMLTNEYYILMLYHN